MMSVATLATVTLLLAGCTFTPSSPTPDVVDTITSSGYHAESWKSIIPESCQTFNDGCNQCSRRPDTDEVACTLMYCEEYAEPKCTDDMVQEIPSEEVLDEISTDEVVMDKIASEYMGLSLEDAQKKAEEAGVAFRVMQLDGEAQPVTADLRPGRINAIVENNLVMMAIVE
ncbi:MAG: hypothetical protein Q4B28_08435 [bacterium]|nr:hypothetical protein [bacterium]